MILDGPTGTRLIQKDFKAHPILWTARASLEEFELLKNVHAEYLSAGANIITANTFRTSSYSALKAGLTVKDARRMTHASVAAITEALEETTAEGPHFIAGSLAPLEDCYKPKLTPALDVLREVHSQTAKWLVEAGCSFLLVETMGTSKEALIAVQAAKKAGADSVAVSFITDSTGRKLLGGESLSDAAKLCVESGAEIVLINCVDLETTELALNEISGLTRLGIVTGAYPNAQRMRIDENGQCHWEAPSASASSMPVEAQAEEFARCASSWAKRFNSQIFGSCCGTEPAHVKALASALSGNL